MNSDRFRFRAWHKDLGVWLYKSIVLGEAIKDLQDCIIE
jgi:hypothetical protein